MELRVNTQLGAFFFFFGVAGASVASLLIQGGTLIDGTGKAPIANANVLMSTTRSPGSGAEAGTRIFRPARRCSMRGASLSFPA